MAMTRRRPFADATQYYTYAWFRNQRCLYVGYGRDGRCRFAIYKIAICTNLSLAKLRNACHIVVDACATRSAAILQQRIWIAWLQPELNINPGNGGRKGMHTPEGLVRIRKSMLGKKPSLSTRRKMSQRLLGNKHLLGYHHTDETKARMSAKHKGRKVSKLCRQKTRERCLLRNQEHPPRAGKVNSPEHRKRISESLRRRYGTSVKRCK